MKCPRILLIEDNKLLRWSLAKGLTREGFTVVAPPTVEEALRPSVEFPFDVLVSDWRLPDGHNGLEVLTAVLHTLPRVVSILISAEADAQLTTKALEAGFRRVIQKPLRISQIVDAIHAIMPRDLPD